MESLKNYSRIYVSKQLGLGVVFTLILSSFYYQFLGFNNSRGFILGAVSTLIFYLLVSITSRLLKSNASSFFTDKQNNLVRRIILVSLLFCLETISTAGTLSFLLFSYLKDTKQILSCLIGAGTMVILLQTPLTLLSQFLDQAWRVLFTNPNKKAVEIKNLPLRLEKAAVKATSLNTYLSFMFCFGFILLSKTIDIVRIPFITLPLLIGMAVIILTALNQGIELISHEALFRLLDTRTFKRIEKYLYLLKISRSLNYFLQIALTQMAIVLLFFNLFLYSPNLSFDILDFRIIIAGILAGTFLFELIQLLIFWLAKSQRATLMVFNFKLEKVIKKEQLIKIVPVLFKNEAQQSFIQSALIFLGLFISLLPIILLGVAGAIATLVGFIISTVTYGLLLIRDNLFKTAFLVNRKNKSISKEKTAFFEEGMHLKLTLSYSEYLSLMLIAVYLFRN